MSESPRDYLEEISDDMPTFKQFDEIIEELKLIREILVSIHKNLMKEEK